jgi:hypothetical protein
MQANRDKLFIPRESKRYTDFGKQRVRSAGRWELRAIVNCGGLKMITVGLKVN